MGDRHSSPLVNKLAFEAYNQKFAPNRTGYDWLSASTKNVDQYLADPLCGGDPTHRTLSGDAAGDRLH